MILPLVWIRFPQLSHDAKLRHIQRWAVKVLQVLNIEVQCLGSPRVDCADLVVANHVSWLDVLVIQSLIPGVFVAKGEVQRWPLIGSIAKACATIFVNRSSARSAHAMVDAAVAAFGQGHSVIAFPEGTSSDGSSLGLFHANIFEGAIKAGAPVQPITLAYLKASTGMTSDAVPFTGNMSLVSSLYRVMTSSTITAVVHIGPRIASEQHTRRSLSCQSHQSIRRQLAWWRGSAD